MSKTFIKKFAENLSQSRIFTLFGAGKSWKHCDLTERERSILQEAVRLCHEHASGGSAGEIERYNYLADRMNESLNTVPNDTCSASGEQVFWFHTAELMLNAYSHMPAKHDRMESWSKAVLRKMSREQQSALESMPTYQTFAEKAAYLSPIFESALTFQQRIEDGSGFSGKKATRNDTVSKIADSIIKNIKDTRTSNIVVDLPEYYIYISVYEYV